MRTRIPSVLICLVALLTVFPSRGEDGDTVQYRICRSMALSDVKPPADARGFLVVDAQLRAYLPLERELPSVQVTIEHIGTGRLIESAVQCSNLVLFPDLPAGVYRLRSVQGRVDTSMAQLRFFYPDVADGYRVPTPQIGYGSSNIYRVAVPDVPSARVRVTPGGGSYLGQFQVRRQTRSRWGIVTEWADDPQRRAELQALFDELYPRLTGKLMIKAAGEG